jgi:hypothetical protein
MLMLLLFWISKLPTPEKNRISLRRMPLLAATIQSTTCSGRLPF